MRYLGGKTNISKDIARLINAIHGRQEPNIKRHSATDKQTDRQTDRQTDSEHTFVSLFCGSCTIESKVQGFDRVILNDKHKYLIALLKAVQNGWIPPETVTEEEHRYVKNHKDENPALTGFVGFACSFGGKFFGGYARDNKGGTRNFARQGKNSLLRDMSTLMNAEILCQDYSDVVIPENAVIYADPPYANTAGYTTGKFDSEAFWEYAREKSDSHIMLISEQSAPPDFVSIWSKLVRRTIDSNKNNLPIRTEHVFIHEKWAHLFPGKASANG